MSGGAPRAYQPVIDYFTQLESKVLYRVLLGGTKHFGYYPQPSDRLSLRAAQELMHERLAGTLRLRPGDHVLDAGCGEGRVAVALARRQHCQVTGITVVPFEVRAARRWAKRRQVADRVSFHEMDYTQLTFPDEHFDAVFTMESLVHAYDVRQTLSEFRRVVKPGGRVAFFEYSIAPDEQLKAYLRTLPPHLQQLRARFGDPDDWVIDRSAMLALRDLRHGRLPGMLHEIGFIDIHEADVTRQVQPALLALHRVLRRAYPVTRLFGAYSAFVNTTVAAEAFPLVVDADLFRYNITTARRAGG